MRIVTYNINGLRKRVSSYGSLQKFLDALEADIICVQETKLSRQELSMDLCFADGYEAFFSITRTATKGRTGYSGVATFCRVHSAFSTTECALPLSAEEGFTGLLMGTKSADPLILSADNINSVEASSIEELSKKELLRLDSEGRCLITDHGHFVLFNVYGPCAHPDDPERFQFKINFYKLLQKKWESLFNQGRRIMVVGDLNISAFPIDSCNPGPDFEDNQCRKWFRKLLICQGGPFIDAFRYFYPDRKEAYTCWSKASGAEEFNYGTRIDHILVTKSCLHQEMDLEHHDFVSCHVKECDILVRSRQDKADEAPKCQVGKYVKLDESDHAPVYIELHELPPVSVHNVPTLAARYMPEVSGRQQSLYSVLQKRAASAIDVSSKNQYGIFHSESKDRAAEVQKKGKKTIQCTLKSFFTRESREASCLIEMHGDEGCHKLCTDGFQHFQRDSSYFNTQHEGSDYPKSLSDKEHACMDDNGSINNTSCSQYHNIANKREEAKVEVASEWQRIQQRMASSIPHCEGHQEPCVFRVVKKGPNSGRGFYVCARAQGPSSNLQARCNHFEWSSSKSTGRGK